MFLFFFFTMFLYFSSLRTYFKHLSNLMSTRCYVSTHQSIQMRLSDQSPFEIFHSFYNNHYTKKAYSDAYGTCCREGKKHYRETFPVFLWVKYTTLPLSSTGRKLHKRRHSLQVFNWTIVLFWTPLTNSFAN